MVMACIDMASVAMAYVLMAYVVMAFYSYGLHMTAGEEAERYWAITNMLL